MADHRTGGRRARAPAGPGPQRIGILLTLLFGIVGALIGGIVTAAIIGAGHLIITFIVSVIVAALLIAVVSHPSNRRYVYGRPRRRVLR